MPGGITITVSIERNALPDVIRHLPQLLDQAQHDLIRQVETAALAVVPIGDGPAHNDRLARSATLYQSHFIRQPAPAAWELVNDALHAGLVYYGNPLSPPRPWFDWALAQSWDWYRTRLALLADQIASL